MQISDDKILDLISGQARVEQAVVDMSERVNSGLRYLNDENEKLDRRLTTVERKVWYGTGLGAALGAILSYLGYTFKH